MAALTRRRSADHRHQCWHIYYGDAHVGTIAERVGNPMTPSRGNGRSVSILDHIRTNTGSIRRRRSTRPAPNSRRPGPCSCRTALRPIFRNGGRPRLGPRGNIKCGTPGISYRRNCPVAVRSASVAPAGRSPAWRSMSVRHRWKWPEIRRGPFCLMPELSGRRNAPRPSPSRNRQHPRRPTGPWLAGIHLISWPPSPNAPICTPRQSRPIWGTATGT
jgi:hypothetical protein